MLTAADVMTTEVVSVELDTPVRDIAELLYTRRMECSATEIPAAQYESYRNFYQAVATADNANVLLKRK